MESTLEALKRLEQYPVVVGEDHGPDFSGVVRPDIEPEEVTQDVPPWTWEGAEERAWGRK